MRICTKATRVTWEGDHAVIGTDAVPLRIWFLTDAIVRVRAGFDGTFRENSYTLTLTGWADEQDGLFGEARTRVTPLPASLEERQDGWMLRSAGLSVFVERDPFRLSVYSRDGRLLHRDAAGIAYAEDRNLRRSHAAELREEDCFYGFGEKTGPFNKKGMSFGMDPSDNIGYDPVNGDSLYKHIPFYVRYDRKNGTACGVFYHTTWRCAFDMGRSHSNYRPRRSLFTADGGDVDWFLLDGPSVADVVRRFTDLTGKSAFLPRYALGYLGSSMYYSELPVRSDLAILEFADEAAARGIPLDGFQLSSGYTAKDGKRYVFTWNPERFPDPENFFREMAKRGIDVSPNVKPGILTDHPFAEEMERAGMFLQSPQEDAPAADAWWGGKGYYIDFTDPGAREKWKDYLKQALLARGAGSVWNDNCEYDGIADGDCRCAGGILAEMKPVMANLMCLAAEEAMRESDPERRPFQVCRAGTAGIQRFAQTWSGDNSTSWESLRYNVATMLGMALCGVSNYGCDVGGFYGPAPEAELLVRWVQNGVFMPRFSIHSNNTDNTVTEPWMYPEVLPAVREAIRLRYRLVPYYYSLMKEASETGLPILRPMVMEFPGDPSSAENGTDFMAGSGLLAACVLEKGQTEREVTLPSGEVFYDLRNGKRYEGGRTVRVTAALDSIPLFLRGGSVVPVSAKDIGKLHRDPVTDLHLLIAPDKDGSFTLYEDDGLTEKYREGDWKKTAFTVKTGETVTVRARKEGKYVSPVTAMSAEIFCPSIAPVSVSLNGRELRRFLSADRLEEQSEGWSFDPSRRSAKVRFPAPEGDWDLRISFAAADLLKM